MSLHIFFSFKTAQLQSISILLKSLQCKCTLLPGKENWHVLYYDKYSYTWNTRVVPHHLHHEQGEQLILLENLKHYRIVPQLNKGSRKKKVLLSISVF